MPPSGPTERDTCRDVILPMLASCGWVDQQVLAEYRVRSHSVPRPDGGRDLGDGSVDYVLEAIGGVPCAVIEAKREYRTAESGLQQALRYAQQLDVPLAYASNGERTIEHNMRTGRERDVDSVATPAEAWAEYRALHGLDPDGAALIGQPFNRRRSDVRGAVVQPRAYQAVAVHRVLRAIAQGSRRILLLMATGTGKTFTAMQIVAKLRSYTAAARPGHNHRVLYLADRTQLLDQPIRKDFTPAFGTEPLERVRSGAGRSHELYFATYQGLTGDDDRGSLFRRFRPDFFDLVIVDECHRGSAVADSAWREVLDHFTSAVQLGLTATPVRQGQVDSYGYFGNPVFSYSLRQGVEDGYLAPFRVRRVVLTPDVGGWEPTDGERDRFGRDIPPGVYTTRDFERTVSLLRRTEIAARHLSNVLRHRPGRAIIFCVDVEHADQMRRAMVDANPDLVTADPEWVVRIVGVEGERERLLGDFCDPDTTSPVVATTSRLLSTGVDIEDLKYVVIFRPVGSMVEFKQIIGRGTRLYPDKGKVSFDIIDYVGATQHFADPEFDGFPADITHDTIDATGAVQTSDDHPSTDPFAPTVNQPTPPFDVQPGGDLAPDAPGPGIPPPRKLYVDQGAFSVVVEAVQVPDRSTGSLRLTDYGDYVKGRVRALGSAEELRAAWSEVTRRHRVITELSQQGIETSDLPAAVNRDDVDPFDVLLQIAWNTPARTRNERARRAHEGHAGEWKAMSDAARAVLQGLLKRYEEAGVDELTSDEVLRVEPLRLLGTPGEIAALLGGPDELHRTVDLAQHWLYSA